MMLVARYTQIFTGFELWKSALQFVSTAVGRTRATQQAITRLPGVSYYCYSVEYLVPATMYCNTRHKVL